MHLQGNPYANKNQHISDIDTPKGKGRCWFYRYKHAKMLKWNRWYKQKTQNQREITEFLN